MTNDVMTMTNTDKIIVGTIKSAYDNDEGHAQKERNVKNK